MNYNFRDLKVVAFFFVKVAFAFVGIIILPIFFFNFFKHNFSNQVYDFTAKADTGGYDWANPPGGQGGCQGAPQGCCNG